MKHTLLFTALLALPIVTFAAVTDFKSLVGMLIGLINQLFLILIALTFLVLVWGIVKGWIIHGGDVESVEKGKKVLYAGIVVFTILASLYGILTMLRTTFFGS